MGKKKYFHKENVITYIYNFIDFIHKGGPEREINQATSITI